MAVIFLLLLECVFGMSGPTKHPFESTGNISQEAVILKLEFGFSEEGTRFDPGRFILNNSGQEQYRELLNIRKEKEMAQTGNNQQINVELGEKEAEGIYSNLALISHSPAEFVLDFTRMLPGVPKTKVYARIIMTPQHAKSFQKALEENVGKYEKQFGEIKLHGHQNMQQPMGFMPPAEQGTKNQKEDK